MKGAGLDEISPEVWKTTEFDDILLRYCNAEYNQKTIDRWTKGFILTFDKKSDHEIAKNYPCISLTFIAAKIYNALLRNRIEPKIEKILKNQNSFRRNRPTTSQFRLSTNSRKCSYKKNTGQKYYSSTFSRHLTP